MPNSTKKSSVTELEEYFRLLQTEYNYEKESYLEKSKAAGIQRKIQQGFCWYPVRAERNYYNSLNLPVIEIVCDYAEETEHSFEHGRTICFFTPDLNGKQHYFNFTATISYLRDNRMVVTLPQSSFATTLQQCTNLGLQLNFDETSYQSMFTALHDVIQAKGNRLAELREILSGTHPIRKREIFPHRFPWLNPQQETAVNNVCYARDIAIVHGPPGTGKTTTLVEAIYETLHKENQVLVCAQSNTAVDWISEKLADRGIPVLRIGNPTRVNDKMLSFTYERRFEAHPDYPELWKIRKTIRELLPQLRKREAGEASYSRLQQLRHRATELEIKIEQNLFSEARVIASTLVGSSNKILEGKRFSTLFIDEAAQALEAACWIAIRKAERVILAGDHCQLPPTIKNTEAAKKGLALTLMQKVALRQPGTVSLLQIQYRMHEDIMHFPSRWFYHNCLQAAPEVRFRNILEFDTPIVWLDTREYDSHEQIAGESFSHINKTEAYLLIRQLQEYMQKIGGSRIIEEQIDFGLISPYKAQIRYMRQLIRKNSFFKPFFRLISVNTVDGFQGQERDVIFISLVRANESGNIGFLKDLRRMNVAITRARMKLIILGDTSTLLHHPFYKAFYTYIQEKGAIIPLLPADTGEKNKN
ncbi:AAA domain-containing protein [uncultured Odoribacter sp.]|uniref:AAA domain-containing protein n=1 Tax=uncultured Odoribacter sp. TaxID=876416 RepID=UPI00263123B7|nr:AAA domain-containing protein [uncultured Odoribacter sp.]